MSNAHHLDWNPRDASILDDPLTTYDRELLYWRPQFHPTDDAKPRRAHYPAGGFSALPVHFG